MRLAYLANHPLCVECEKLGRVTAAVVVDHVVDRRDAPERAYDESNFQGLCISHHNRKTAQTQARRRREGK